MADDEAKEPFEAYLLLLCSFLGLANSCGGSIGGPVLLLEIYLVCFRPVDCAGGILGQRKL